MHVNPNIERPQDTERLLAGNYPTDPVVQANNNPERPSEAEVADAAAFMHFYRAQVLRRGLETEVGHSMNEYKRVPVPGDDGKVHDFSPRGVSEDWEEQAAAERVRFLRASSAALNVVIDERDMYYVPSYED